MSRFKQYDVFILEQLSYDIQRVVECLGTCHWSLLESEPEGEL